MKHPPTPPVCRLKAADLRSNPPTGFFYDHARFVSECKRLRGSQSTPVLSLIEKADDWLTPLTPEQLADSFRRLPQLTHLSWASGITGSDKYAKAAVAYLDAYWKERGDWVNMQEDIRRRLMHGPESGILIQNMATFYCTLDMSSAPDDLLEKSAGIMTQIADALLNDDMKLYFSNVYLFRLIGIMMTGIVFPSWERSRKAMEFCPGEIFKCLEAQFRPDGGHIEQSPGYATAVIRNTAMFMELCRTNGIAIPDKTYSLYRKAGETLLNFDSGGGCAFDCGDTHSQVGIEWVKTCWNYGLADSDKVEVDNNLHTDCIILGICDVPSPDRTMRTLPKPVSTFLPQSGYCFLRSEDSDLNAAMLFDCGPHGHYHGHYDALSIVLSVRGTYLLPDPGTHPYDSSADRMAAMSTAYHSTLSLDTQNYASWEDDEHQKGKITAWNISPDGSVQVSARHDGYSHLTGTPRLTRQIWYDGSRTWIVLDRLICLSESRRERTFALTSSFNLPDETSIFLSEELDFLETRLENAPNLRIDILNPCAFAHIGLQPCRRNTGGVITPTKRLCLTTNAHECAHVSILRAYDAELPPLTIECPDFTARDKARIRISTGNTSTSILFEAPDQKPG